MRAVPRAGNLFGVAFAETAPRDYAEAQAQQVFRYAPFFHAMREQGVRDMFTGEPLPEQVLSANAYLGATPVARALAQGADIVITGRCVDSAVTLGVLMHEFGWSDTDHDRLAGGSLAGHIIECRT